MSQTVSVKFSPGPAAAPVNVLLSAVNDPEAAIALAGNRPLPFRDLDLGSIKMQFGPASALKVPVGNQILMVETNGSAHLGLGSYLTLDKALAVVAPGTMNREHFTFEPQRSMRYSVLSAGWMQSASGGIRSSPAPGIDVGFSAGGSAGGRLAVIAQVRRNAGARDQLAAAFSGWTLPASIRDVQDLSPHHKLLYGVDGTLEFRGDTRIGFDLNWAKKPVNGKLDGALGMRVGVPVTASVHYRLAGSFLYLLDRDFDGWLRLRVLRQKQSGTDFAAQLEVSASPLQIQDPADMGLLRALAGLHESQWLSKALTRFAGNDLDSIRQVWTEMPGGVREALWDAATGEQDLVDFSAWVSWLRERFENAAEIGSEVYALMGPDPVFWNSRAGQTAERLLQDLRDRVADSNWFEPLRKAVPMLDSLLSDAALRSALLRARRELLQLLEGRLRHAVASLDAYRTLPAPVRNLIEATLFPVRDQQSLERLRSVLHGAGSLEGRIYSAATQALAQRLRLELAWRYQSAEAEEALVDCSFCFNAEAMELYQQALQGDFRSIFAGFNDSVRLRRGSLTHALQQRSRLDLQLPMMARKSWVEALESRTALEVSVDESGRILVYNVKTESRIEEQGQFLSLLLLSGGLKVGGGGQSETFRMTYRDEQKLEARQLETSLSAVLDAYNFPPAVRSRLVEIAAQGADREWIARLTITTPANLAGAWLQVPPPKSRDYFQVCSRVSVSVQRALRRWLPYVYFSDTARYKDLGAALPLLAWSHSLPCTGFSRYELTYDSMNQKHVQLLLASAQRGLAAQLPQIGSLLQRKGLNSTAKYYLGVSSRQVVAEQIRSPRLVKSLMYSDASLVDSIVDLLEKGHHLNQLLTSDPQAAVRSLNKFSAEFTKTFHTKLKRLYGGRQFLAFSTLLLAEATSALNEALGQPAPLMASLELTPAGKTNAPAQIFLNPAFRT